MHQVLRLSENGIESVDRKAFMNLGTSLEQLDLSGNQLKLIEEETFRPLYGLQVSLKTMQPYSYRRRDHRVSFDCLSKWLVCHTMFMMMMHNHDDCICLNQLKLVEEKTFWPL